MFDMKCQAKFYLKSKKKKINKNRMLPATNLNGARVKQQYCNNPSTVND